MDELFTFGWLLLKQEGVFIFTGYAKRKVDELFE